MCPNCKLFLCIRDKVGLYTIKCPRCGKVTDEKESKPIYDDFKNFQKVTPVQQKFREFINEERVPTVSTEIQPQ